MGIRESQRFTAAMSLAISHDRGPSHDLEVAEPNQYKDPSQNEVKIEEYDSDQYSGRHSRSNSIKFVMLKQDVMFENPETPFLRKFLGNKVR